MSPHKANCTDKSELGIDDEGNDFCMNCGETILPDEDQFIIQQKFLTETHTKKINELRGKIGKYTQQVADLYLEFAVLLGSEIGKSQNLSPDELDIRIMLDGKIIVSAGEHFRVDFDNYNKMLEFLLCMVRLQCINDGADVMSAKKTETQVYYAVEKQITDFDDDDVPKNCVSCGKPLPPLDPEELNINDLCEACYQDGET